MIEGTRVCWPEQGKVTLEPFTLPELRPGEVLIETEVTLISPGTERAFFLELPNATPRYPYYPGYCNIGKVTAVAESTQTDLLVGDRVACGGNHASHVRFPADHCWKVPDGLPSTEAV